MDTAGRGANAGRRRRRRVGSRSAGREGEAAGERSAREQGGAAPAGAGATVNESPHSGLRDGRKRTSDY